MKQVTARESGPSADRISDLAFSEIPGQSALFLRYLDDPLSLKRFYPNVSATPIGAVGYAAKVLAAYTADRVAICARLEAINHSIGSGPATFANIQKLAKADCVAVVTGQQAGLLTGPLYTIYKALSAVKLAAELNEQGVSAVPIFWAATEDHDFDEVAAVDLIDNNGNLKKHTWTPEPPANERSVGGLTLDETIKPLLEAVTRTLGSGPFAAETADLFQNAWRPGDGFGKAFGRTIAKLFESFGLVYVDPLDAGLKRLASPIYESAVERADEIATRVQLRGKELVAAGFHEQVTVEADYFPLFWHDEDGRRLALRKTADGLYRPKEGKQAFTSADLQQIARDSPESFSPGVMLRPVVQDYLFPTLCYFGGGAELAYFAQNSEVYEVLGRPVTPIFHRQSFTVVESRQARSLERLEVGLIDLFAGDVAVRLSLAERSGTGTAETFATAEERINTELNRLDQAVSAIDPTVAANLAKRRHKIIYHIAATRRKALLAQVRNDEIVDRRVRELFASLMPHGALQERSVNVFYYFNKYGPGFIDRIYEAIDLDDKNHRLIRI